MLLVAPSAPGMNDGEAYYWMNGELRGSEKSLQWVKSDDPSVLFDGIRWYCVRNGVNTYDTWFKVGEFYISGR